MFCRRRAKDRKKKDQNKSSDKFKHGVLILNIILFFMLIFLIGYEVIYIRLNNSNEYSAEYSASTLVSASIENITPEQDLEYINNALVIDEMDDIRDIINIVINGSSAASQEVLSWEDKIAHIDNININPETLYGMYEEKLPDDIIDTPPAPDKQSNIKIEAKHNPPHLGEYPLIAIVIDDMGISRKRTKDISSLKYPITASFLTYAANLDEQAEKAKASGQEVIAHIPMEPKVMKDVSPDVLTVKMNDKQIENDFRNMLSKFDGIKGVNNHMGSRFTEDEKRMEIVMKELAKHNMFFLDSKTTSKSAVDKAAKKHNVNYVSRNVFLDNQDDFKYIMGQLKQTEDIARKNGYAVAIGHPKTQTYRAIQVLLPSLDSKKIELIHLSKLVDILNYKSIDGAEVEQ